MTKLLDYTPVLVYLIWYVLIQKQDVVSAPNKWRA